MPLKQSVSALAKSTIKIAYDELDRTINPEDKQTFSNTALHDVREAALRIENQLAARQSLRNMRRLMPLFRGLEHYSKVVDVLCNGTPYLPWIWAPITLILRISSEYVEAFEQIIKGYASIAESLKRFEILSNALINEPGFQQTVAVFYADILKFHKYAYKFVRRSGWKLIFSASWGRFERKFGNILEDLKQHGTLIDLEANAHNISQAKKMRDDIRKWREESENRLRQEDNEQCARQYGSIVSWLTVNDVDQLAIVDSITSEVEKYQGTCGWLLKNKSIRSWADAKPNTPALWLKGSAGTGKSVMCTQLINFLKETRFVICHFCTYLYAASTMYEQILKSLLVQILRRDADLAAHVYKTCVMERKSPTTPVLENMLQELFASMSSEPSKAEYVWVIIDGLDECDSDKQQRLVRLINRLTSKPVVAGSTGCKVLISSRAPSAPLERLMRKQVISLNEEKSVLNEAVCQYVGQRLTLMDTKLRQLNVQRAEVAEIQDMIVTKSDGMFLYARLVMDYLSSNLFFGRHELKESVNQLPRKLSDFYQRILSQILAPLDHRSEDRIRCVLGWIAFAKRPLRKAELMSAITFSSGDHEISDLVPEYIIDIVGTLIEERRDSTLSFIHNSVKEFLQTSSQPIFLRERQSLQEHAVATVACLISGLKFFDDAYPAHDRVLRVAKGLHGFHVYATEFWTEILAGYDDDKEHDDSTTRLVCNKIGALLASYQNLVKFLLGQTYYPDLSPVELESFKANFAAAAFTCQLRSCSYATIGFHTEERLKEHELEHTRRFQCTVPGCQYPPCLSKSGLESHMKRNHNPAVSSKPALRHMLASKQGRFNGPETPHRESSVNRQRVQETRSSEDKDVAMVDLEDAPPSILREFGPAPPYLKTSGRLKTWLRQHPHPQVRKGLEPLQAMQYQFIAARKPGFMSQEQLQIDQKEQQQLSTPQNQQLPRLQQHDHDDSKPDRQAALRRPVSPTTVPAVGEGGDIGKSPYVGMPEDFMAYLFNDPKSTTPVISPNNNLLNVEDIISIIR
ncbi:hypothetical protein FPOA_09341 [Fusarium poae]|uniref:NACHT domain-containing protein n=1 Tax=Fusarium poae TaxID=36050 RepID=A0A1B8AR80_FUSPO|nr:hypothetical protein FPOA_09341 [Fusarium poae]